MARAKAFPSPYKQHLVWLLCKIARKEFHAASAPLYPRRSPTAVINIRVFLKKKPSIQPVATVAWSAAAVASLQLRLKAKPPDHHSSCRPYKLFRQSTQVSPQALQWGAIIGQRCTKIKNPAPSWGGGVFRFSSL